MKGLYLSTIFIIFISMVLFPLFSMESRSKENNTSEPQYNVSYNKDDETLRVMMTQSDSIYEMSMKEYVIGVVAAEMPAEYEIEALKAQAVVAYTYALYKSDLRKTEDYDVTDSSKTDQAFLSEATAKERFGDNYEKYIEKITLAVNEVLGQTITYDGKVILACCHSISGGKTESAEAIWGGSYPYLMPVESVGDVLNPKYLSEVTVKEKDVKSTLEKLDVKIEGDADSWFKEAKKTESGTVTKINVCNKELKGSEIRTAFGLRSANFDIEYSDSQFKFTVRGYGHGVGMSQYGAQFMAQQGSSYKDILSWYYTDCTITE